MKNKKDLEQRSFVCEVRAEESDAQYSCLENPMDRGAWQATYRLWGRKESDMTERLSTHIYVLYLFTFRSDHFYKPSTG